MGKAIIVIHVVFMTLFILFAASLDCPRGTYLYTIVHSGQAFCIECSDGTFMSLSDHQQTACRPCEEIREPELEILVSPCNKTHEAVIHCVKGYYRDEARNPRETGQCRKCKHCEFPGQACSTYRDTVCCHGENFDVVPNKHGIPMCRERPWFCKRGQYFETKGFYCLQCPDNTFMPFDYHIQTKCLECRDLEADRPLHSVIIQPCNSTHAPVIACEDGFYRNHEMGYRDDAIGCSQCTDCSTKADSQYEGRKCDSMEDSVCCPQANMAVVDTPEGPVCSALSANYGELEQSFGNELDLKAKKEACPKVSDHANLLSVEDFAIDQLPLDSRDELYLAYIKAIRDLTVRLRVYHVSDERPENDPYYGLRGLAGKGLRRFGSGLVYGVSKSFDKCNNEKCPCKDCQVFPEYANTKWAEFLVVTSAQIVFDEAECSQASCKLWNDKDENPGNSPSIKGWEIKEIDRQKDFCIMRCVSHSPDFIRIIEKRVEKFNKLRAQNKQASNDTTDVNKQAILIAHPHGLSKKIVVRNAHAEGGQVRKWTYDANTCPGCLGAPVCLLSKDKASKILITIYNGNCESRGFELEECMSATTLDVDEH